MLQQFTNLKPLRISGCGRVSQQSINALEKALPHLHKCGVLVDKRCVLQRTEK